MGFPGLSVGYLRALASNVDLSVRVAGNYAYEGLPSMMVLGGRAEAGLRLRLLEIAGMSLGLHAGAGVLAYFPLGGYLLGLALPLGVTVGVPLGPTFAASAGVEFPLWVAFGTAGGLTVPVLGSAGLEYFLNKEWAATLRARVGPAFNPSGFRFGGPSPLELNVYAGIALRL